MTVPAVFSVKGRFWREAVVRRYSYPALVDVCVGACANRAFFSGGVGDRASDAV
jgi:hypothetical protein